MRRHLVVLLLMFATIAASAAPAADRWTEIRSPHFTVLTNSNEKNGRRIANQLEQMRSIFHAIFPTGVSEDDVPITVFALKDKKSFQAMDPAEYLGKGKLDLAGYFQRAQEKNYIILRLDAQGEHPFAIVYHEYTHYMLRKMDDWLPVWLNEGMAEFYQNTDIDGKQVRLGQPSAANINLLRDNRLIPLPTLLQIDHASPYYHEQQKGNIFYAESWALTHYLLISDSDNKTHRLQDYGSYMMQGQDSIAAARSAFGDLTALNRALEMYVHQLNFKLYKLNYVPTVNGASFQAKPIENADVDTVRADILGLAGRQQEARTLLGSVLQEDPKNAAAHENMGFLELRDGNSSIAEKWFGEAVQLNSTSFLAHYYYGLLRVGNGDVGDDAVVISSLNEAIALNPKFAPAYDTLARFYASREQKPAEAYIQEVRACAVEPDNVNYRMNAASFLADSHRFADALAVLEGADRIARSSSDKANVEFRIQQTKDFQANIERQQKQSAGMAKAGMVTMQGGTTPMIGHMAVSIREASTTPKYPTEPPTGNKHIVRGVLRNVQCYYPTIMTFSIVLGDKVISVYSNNYPHIEFTAANFTPQGKMNPCTAIEGMKARVQYSEVSDKSIAGQIVSVELTK